MILGAAALLAVSSFCGVWYFMHLRSVQSAVTERIATLPKDLAFPYHFEENSANITPPPPADLTLEESYHDNLSRTLYLARFRSKKAAVIFRWVTRTGYILAGFLLLTGILSGTFSIILVLRAAVLGFGIPFAAKFFIKLHRKKMVREITRTLPQVLDLLIVSMEAGLNFTAALPHVLDEMDPEESIIKEFRVMYNEYLNGLSFSQACDRLAHRCEISDLSLVAGAIMESEQTGSSLSNVLRIHAHELRDKLRQRLREDAHKLPVKLLFPMMMIFLTVFTVALGPSLYRMKNLSKSLDADLTKSEAKK